MLRKFRRPALVAGLAATASALVLASASSAAQDRWTDSFGYDGSAPCDTFTNLWTGQAEERGMTTYDKNTNPVKDIVHQTGTELDWRRTRDGVLHASTLEGVAAGLAWAAGQWPRRFEVAALLEDPSRTEELARDRWFD